MQHHTLQRHTQRKESAPVGRGGKRGKTSGRGTKGQKSRAGHKIRPEMRDIIKKLPKLRGRGKNSMLSIQTKPMVVNVGDLNTTFNAGETITPALLATKGLVKTSKAAVIVVKILGGGELSKKITVSGCKVSTAAQKKIEAAGGTIVS